MNTWLVEFGRLIFIWVLLLSLGVAEVRAADFGVFEAQLDIGSVQKPGSAVFDAAANSYVVSGSGENMWFTNDACHMVWRRMSNDFSLSAAVEWVNAGGNAHRKACLIVRQTVEPDAPYVDVAIHGNGLVSLQFRATPGGMTHEIQARQPEPASGAQGAPGTLTFGLQRQGDVFFLTAPDASGKFVPQGAFTRLRFTDPVYVGLAVCAHDAKAIESARFSHLALQAETARAEAKAVLHCALETVAINSHDRRLRYHTTDLIEAPNWTRDGRFFLFNSGGHMFRLPAGGGAPERIDTGAAHRCNNDHGLSPDGTQLAISDQSQDGKSRIYVLPSAGGAPRLITPLAPSYWHGWSPDGSTLAYCAERDREFDVYTIPVQGGQETRLTSAPGLDDGPDYSPDGKFIYFNSERSGSMQIWRMHPDGTHQEQVTADDFNNWFAHPSPDGRWLVFLSYARDVKGHPANQAVRLRLLALDGAGHPVRGALPANQAIIDLAELFGGQGTINVCSWSPDSREVAFVSYELIRP
ncbi:MAG TPA: hypothetical protein VG167_03760 [Verrucomicrobiae bacterium]|nr:hypothetical protein [Verrucomicrobiae bacterium]